MSQQTAGSSRPLLVVAHPGHELRVHGWLESAQPVVWVLTDGSGRTQHSRIDSTTRVLATTGAAPGPVFGRFTDQDLYNAVLDFEHHHFIELVDELVGALVKDGIDFIAGDAEEGYNPAHDVCRFVINAAVNVVNRKLPNQIANYDFTLVGSPNRSEKELCTESLCITLDEAAFVRKLSAARNYPELQTDVEEAFNGFDTGRFRRHPALVERARSAFGVTEVSDFRTECLRPVNSRITANSLKTGIPFYEVYGETQVKAGHYSRVLRYQQHMQPLMTALNSHVERSSWCQG